MKKIYYLMFMGLLALVLSSQSSLYAQISGIQTVETQCYGDNDGKIIMTTLLGTTITDVLVDGAIPSSLSANMKTVSELVSGNYTLSVTYTNANGTADSVFSVFVAQPSELNFELEYTYDCADSMVTEVCVTNNGSFGGVPPYKVSWLTNSNFVFNFNDSAYSIPCMNASVDTTGLFPIDMTSYSGDIELYIYDSKDCFLSQSKILETPSVTGDLIAAQGACQPINSGSLEVQNVSGGVPPYSYVWSTGDTTTIATKTGLVPGNYSVTILDSYECASVVLEEEIPDPNDLAIDETITDVACNGDASGSISLNILNGSGNYLVAWSTGAGGPAAIFGTLDNLTAGNYGVTVNDITTGCMISSSYIVNEPTAVTVSLSSSTSVLCAGSCDATAVFAANGGVTPYNYDLFSTTTGQIGSTQSSPEFTGLCAGTFYVQVTDANGCTANTADFVITEPGALDITLSSTPVSCYGGNDGSITLNLTGGTFPFSFVWVRNLTDTIQGTSSLQNLESGTYCVTVTDANNCVISDCITLAEPTYFEVLIDSVNHVICHGGNEGNIGVTVYGGATPYSFAWYKDGGPIYSNIEDLTYLENGVYQLIVTDGNGCTAITDTIINEPPPLTILGQVERVSCYGECDGRVKAVPEGGTPGSLTGETWDYQYRLDTTTFSAYTPWQIDSFFYGLCPGFYSLQVIDGNGCTSKYPDFEIWEPTELVASFNYKMDVTCNGNADGEASVNATGGTTPYTFAWSNGSTDQSISGLSGGTYDVTVIDESFCEAYFSFTIQEPALLQASATSTDVTCCNAADGTVDLTVIGGVAPYTYQWSNLATTEDLNNLGPDTYCVTVTDFNGCEVMICAPTVVEPPCVDATFTKVDIDCYGNGNGSIDVTVTGGTIASAYQFAWDNGESTEDLSNLGPGVYNLTVTDDNGCFDNISATIFEPTLLEAAIVGTNITCCNAANGAADLTVTGGTAPYSFTWSNLETTEDLVNLGPSTYTVTVTDANNCTATAYVSITEPACLDLQLTSTMITCFGDNDGSITTTISGGVMSYSFAWEKDNGTYSSDQNLAGLSAGTYCLTVTDFNGCTITACETITEPAELIVNETHIDIDCYGNNNGSIDLSIAGGNGGNMISWNNGESNEDLSNLGPDTYCVTVTDSKGCNDDLCVVIDEPTLLEAVITSFDNVTCYGYANGNINSTISGGTTPYTIVWSSGDNTEDLTNIGPGTYYLTVTDANNCVATASQEIIEPDVFVVDLYMKTDVSCYGLSDGMIDAIVTGGTQPVTYLWSNGETTEDISGIPAGNYCLTVTDFNGCEATLCIDILEPNELEVTLNTKVDVDCFGNANGNIDVDVNGGTAPYTYAWSNGETTQDISSLSPNNYCVTVTDANYCTDTLCIDIYEPTELTLVVDGYGDITCHNLNNGFINVTIDGGVTPYTYNWTMDGNTFAATEDLDNLAPGEYCLTVTDANYCTETMTCITLTQPELLVATIVSYQDVTCYSFANGSADLSVTGGTTVYTYLWSNGSTTEDLVNVGPGNYDVTVTDANSCEAYASVTISEPVELTVIGSETNITCYGYDNGAIDINVNGGTPTYTYLWNDGVTIEDRTNLAPGAYSVTVTDLNQCITTGTWTITEPNELMIINPVVTNVTIYGGNDGAIDIDVTGGTAPYSYVWSNGETTQDISGLTIGTYTVTVTDLHDCQTTGQWTITQPEDLTISITTTDIPCYNMDNGIIDLTIYGGTPTYSIVWEDANGTIISNNEDLQNLDGGTYYVTVTDAAGDIATGSATIDEPAELVLSETHVDILCYGNSTGSIDLTIVGGTPNYTITWSTGETTEDINGLAAGTYDVTVVDSHQCEAYLSVPITEPTALSISGTTVDPLCYGDMNGEINITVDGGTAPYTYDWDNGETTEDLTGLGAGMYSVVVTDANNCTINDYFTLTQPDVLDVQVVDIVNVNCYGNANGEIDITVTGGTTAYTFAWSNGETTEDLVNLGPGMYYVTVTDANNCTATAMAEITEPAELLATNTALNVTCNGYANGEIDVTVTGGTLPYGFVWSNGETTEDLANLGPDTYCLTITDANNCVFTLCETITEPAALTISGTTVNPLCYGDMNGEINITVGGGTAPYTYDWDNGETTEDLSGLGAGMYSVVVTDANNCVINDYFTLTQPDVLDVQVVDVVNVDCYGNANGEIDITVTGGTTAYTFAWSNGETTEDLVNLGPGMYYVTVTDVNNCTATAMAEITEPTALTLAGTVTNIVCYGEQSGAIDITADGGVAPYTYLWNDGNQNEDRSYLLAGTYCVTVTDANGCEITDCFIVNEPPLLSLSLDVHDLLCVDGTEGWIEMTITGGVAPYDIVWSNGEITEIIDTLIAGTYCVTVTDAYGCVATACGTVDQPQYPLAALYITGENVDCYGNNNGWFEVMATGGAAPYQYSLDYSPFTNFIDTPMLYNNLVPGFHLLTIGDSNNCEILYDIEITEPDPLELTFVWDNNDCYGQTMGWIDMTISGGTLYEYLQTCNCDTMCHTIEWSNGETTEDISNLAAGTYTVTVTDCNGCIATASIEITQPTPLVLTYNKIDLNCFGDASGEIDLMVTGGTAPYTYLWNNGETTEDLMGLSGGFYVVTVTDANGCVANTTVMITEPAPTQLDFDVTDIMCTGTNDGAIDLLLQDSVCLSYQWSNGATTQDINNLAPGWYWVTVIDCNGCVAIDSACVYAPNNELAISYTVHDVLCYGGNTGWIELDAIGGTMPYVGIQWTGVVPTECCGLDTVVLDSIQLWGMNQTSDVIENLAAGTYYVTLTDAYGCQAVEIIEVEQPNCPVHIANNLITDVDMGVMGAIDIYVCCGTFPYTYYWELDGTFFSDSEDLENLSGGVYNVTVTDANGCTTEGSFIVDSHLYPGWTNGISESSHTIYIPENAVPELSIGDYIGVFYDSLGTIACGGFVKWEGIATTIAAWGDDGIDPSDETGFVDGEEFTWIVWDASTGIEYAACPAYDLSPMWPSDSTYEVNGISSLMSLSMGTVLDNQVISLTAGWNLISTYIDPLIDNVEHVFAPIVSDLIIVKNGAGQVYWPQWNVNVIGTLAIGEGYKVKMSTTLDLVVEGAVIVPEATTITIPVEWSILGYLRMAPASIEELLSSIVNDVIIVKNEAGHVYWPSWYNINTIGNMMPGEGYHIKMSNTVNFTYAANGLLTKSGASATQTQHFKAPASTGSNMTIGVPQSAWTSNPVVGDEVAVLNANGDVLGASVYTGCAMYINLWGDDAVTNRIEGIEAGANFSLAIWNSNTNSVQSLVIDTWSEGKDSYEENAISIVGKFRAIDTEENAFALFQNQPNPFANTTQIRFSIPVDTYVHVGVYNLVGELIEEIVGTDMNAGAHTVEYNGSTLAAGSYLYKIVTDDYSASKQMNIVK